MQTSSLNAIGGATRLGASCPCGGGSSMSWDLTWRTKLYCIDAARVVTDSKLVVKLQKSDGDPVKYHYEERLTNPCLMSAELAMVRTALTCYSGKKECPVLLLWSTEYVLNSILWRTGSQCRKCNRSELGEWRPALQTIRVAFDWTRWMLSRFCSLIPTNNELQ